MSVLAAGATPLNCRLVGVTTSTGAGGSTVERDRDVLGDPTAPGAVTVTSVV